MRRRLVLALALALVATMVWFLLRHQRDALAPPATSPASTPAAHGRPPATAAIEGTVRDDKGQPIAGARVCGAAVDVVCAVTERDGRYRLAALAPGAYEITAAARGHEPAMYRDAHDRHRTPVVVAVGQQRGGIDLVLPAGGVELTGTVVDIGGGPIVHARVRVAAPGFDLERPHWFAGVETDSKGAFALSVLPGDLQIQAAADGYATVVQDATAPGQVRVLMTPEGAITGLVVDAQNHPVEGAAVTANAVDIHVHAYSDASGRFTIEGLSPARYDVEARVASGFGRSLGTVHVPLGGHVDLGTIRLDPAAHIAGRVVVEHGAACSDPSVQLHDAVHQRDVDMVSDGDGALHADGVLAATYIVRAHCEGYYAAPPLSPLVVTTRDQTGLVWQLARGGSIRGHVRRSDGTPVDRAMVSAHSPKAYADELTIADGSFVVSGLAPADYDVTVSDDASGEAAAKISIVGAATVDHDFTLDDGARISGIVVDPAGHPVPGLEVHANADEAPASATSGADGRFTMAVRPGTYEVVAGVDWQHPLHAPQVITVVARDSEDVKLVVPAQDATIRGDVKDATGKPVGDAFVSAYQPTAFGDPMWRFTWNDHPVLTAPDGTFEITGLGSGSYTVEASRRAGGETQKKDVETGTTVHLVVPATGSLAGTVEYADHTAPDDFHIVVRDASQTLFLDEEFHHTRGAFTLHDVTPGVLTLAAITDDGLGTATTELAAGEQHTGVTIQLERNVDVTGRLVDAITHSGVPDKVIIVRTKRALIGTVIDGDDTRNRTDRDGRFLVQAPRGAVDIDVFGGADPRAHTVCRTEITRTLDGPTDLGDLIVVQSRRNGAPAGVLGFEYAAQQVTAVDPRGPAAGLRKGDTITSVDGVALADVPGCLMTLLDVAAGTTVAIGVQRGVTVKVTAGQPR